MALEFSFTEDGRSILRGNLSDLSWPQLLLWLFNEKSKGKLSIQTSKFEQRIYFEDGFPVATRGGPSGYFLGRMLLEKGIINDQAYMESLQTMSQKEQLQGQALIESGAIDQKMLISALSGQLQRKLVRIFRWPNAAFNFESLHELEEQDIASHQVNPYRIIGHGIRQYYKEERLQSHLSSLSKMAIRLKEPKNFPIPLVKLPLEDDERLALSLLKPWTHTKKFIAQRYLEPLPSKILLTFLDVCDFFQKDQKSKHFKIKENSNTNSQADQSNTEQISGSSPTLRKATRPSQRRVKGYAKVFGGEENFIKDQQEQEQKQRQEQEQLATAPPAKEHTSSSLPRKEQLLEKINNIEKNASLQKSKNTEKKEKPAQIKALRKEDFLINISKPKTKPAPKPFLTAAAKRAGSAMANIGADTIVSRPGPPPQASILMGPPPEEESALPQINMDLPKSKPPIFESSDGFDPNQLLSELESLEFLDQPEDLGDRSVTEFSLELEGKGTESSVSVKRVIFAPHENDFETATLQDLPAATGEENSQYSAERISSSQAKPNSTTLSNSNEEEKATTTSLHSKDETAASSVSQTGSSPLFQMAPPSEKAPKTLASVKPKTVASKKPPKEEPQTPVILSMGSPLPSEGRISFNEEVKRASKSSSFPKAKKTDKKDFSLSSDKKDFSLSSDKKDFSLSSDKKDFSLSSDKNDASAVLVGSEDSIEIDASISGSGFEKAAKKAVFKTSRSNSNLSRLSKRKTEAKITDPEEEITIGKRKSEILKKYKSLKKVNYYELLNISPSASTEAIRKSYYKLSKTYHPDSVASTPLANLRKELDIIFSHLSEAYSVLNSVESRTEYNLILEDPDAQALSEQATQAAKAEVFYTKASVFLKMKDYAAAEKELKWACQLLPNEGEYHVDYAWAAYKSPKNSKEQAIKIALEHLDLALGHKAPSVKYNLYTAYIQKDLGNPKVALKHFEKVLELKPRHSEAVREARYLNIQLNKDKKPEKKSLFGRFKK